MSTLKLIYNSRCIELFLVVKNILFSKLTFSVFILCRFKAFECYVMTRKYKFSGEKAGSDNAVPPVPSGVKKERGCPWTQVCGLSRTGPRARSASGLRPRGQEEGPAWAFQQTRRQPSRVQSGSSCE